MVGAVVSFSTSTNLAVVQPVLADPRQDLDTGDTVYESWPKLTCSVLWPGAAGMVFCWPLAQNDVVDLVAYDFDPGDIARLGTQVVNPTNLAKLSGHTWHAVPRMSFFTTPPAELAASSGGPVLGIPGDQAQVRWQKGTLMLGMGPGGAAPTSYVALASLVANELTAIKNAIAGLQVAIPGGYTAPPGGGTCTPLAPVEVGATSTSPYTPGSVAATVAKAT